MREIPLTQGAVALIDDEDYERVAPFKWHMYKNKRLPNPVAYAVHSAIVGGRKVSVRMHRLILDAPAGVAVDHANGNGLDNRRSNLRLASASQNAANLRSATRSKYGYRGVVPCDGTDGYCGKVKVRGCLIQSRVYRTVEEAARARDAIACHYFGEFAALNFPHETPASLESVLRAKTSRYRGVCYIPKDKKWRANIGAASKIIYLGQFDSEEEAARAYDAKAVELHGARARLNFPDERGVRL